MLNHCYFPLRWWTQYFATYPLHGGLQNKFKAFKLTKNKRDEEEAALEPRSPVQTHFSEKAPPPIAFFLTDELKTLTRLQAPAVQGLVLAKKNYFPLQGRALFAIKLVRQFFKLHSKKKGHGSGLSKPRFRRDSYLKPSIRRAVVFTPRTPTDCNLKCNELFL